MRPYGPRLEGGLTVLDRIQQRVLCKVGTLVVEKPDRVPPSVADPARLVKLANLPDHVPSSISDDNIFSNLDSEQENDQWSVVERLLARDIVALRAERLAKDVFAKRWSGRYFLACPIPPVEVFLQPALTKVYTLFLEDLYGSVIPLRPTVYDSSIPLPLVYRWYPDVVLRIVA